MKAETFSEGGIVYVRINDTKVYRLEVLLKETKQHAIAREVRDNARIKRRVAQSMTDSIDMPDSRASRADVADNRPLERLVNFLDAPATAAMKVKRLQWAEDTIVDALNLILEEDKANVWIFLFLIMRLKEGAKPFVMTRLKISKATYFRRLTRYAEILEAAQRGGCQQGG